ncbi:NAD kinase associated with ferric reductase [Moelleriella libera RCEF 2490]|uniref:NAD kinase associated with ferric reductase n=1 Tax=Moelleriella libera RCEF 2490 TaxID=1081109 RepID=A0A168B2E1_9HYPO|nr:NAD kinase associated with ferric reductase [Moelleriella libera RCEF 2490]
MAAKSVLSPTTLHPAVGGSVLDNTIAQAALDALTLDRPRTAGASLNLSVNTAKATRAADDASTPLSAAPALGRGSFNTASDKFPAWPWASETIESAACSQGRQRRATATEPIPRQTIIKAIASIVRKDKPEDLALASMLSKPSEASGSAAASSQMLADALQDLARKQATPTSASALTALQSPCFYHQRFDDAVNIDKVLEEIKNDESMSHSRLVQTATGVREVSKQLQRRPIKRAVRNVMIVTKARDHQLVYLTRELTTWLLRTPRYGSQLGVNVYVDAKLRDSKRFDAPAIMAENPCFEQMLRYWTPDFCWNQPEKFDLVLTLGGDGTVLFTSWLFQRIVPPVLSFSLGSLGFMTTFEFEKYKFHLNRVMGDDGMKINLRMRFTCTVWRHDAQGGHVDEGEQFEVLNELVIDRGPSPYVSNLELYGDDELLTVVQADGCIFSTPTGSTAYSLSAGGSLVHPDIPAILLTPICPHTLSFRPMVLSDTMALRVAVPRNSRATAYCAFDGKGRVELRQGDYVTITASQYPFPTVTRTDTEWFDSVSRTLRWNVRAAAQKPFEPGSSDRFASQDGGEDAAVSWDIDADSAYYPSEDGSVSASPIRRQMSMLGL